MFSIKPFWLMPFIGLLITFIGGDAAVTKTTNNLSFQITQNANLSTDQHINRTQPSWSPLGNEIAFRQITYDDTVTRNSIWKFEIAKNECVNLTPDYEGMNGSPIWSPDGEWIAFTSDRSGNLDVWIMRPDGSSLTNITSDNPNTDGAPIWSPDSTSIAVESSTANDSETDLRVINLVTKRVINLTPDSDTSWKSPTWSPDSNTIAGIANASNNKLNGIWLINVSTLKSQAVIQSEDKYSLVSWSPSDHYLALATENLELWELNLENSNLTKLTEKINGASGRPVWSADGTQIAYYLRNGDNVDVGLINWDGSNPMNLSSANKGRNEFPTWSPDSQSIIFESGDSLGLSSDLWHVNKDGTDLRKLVCEAYSL